MGTKPTLDTAYRSEHREYCVVNPATGALTNHHPVPTGASQAYVIGERVKPEEATHVIVTVTTIEPAQPTKGH